MTKKGGVDIEKTFLEPAFNYLVKNGLENSSMRDLCKAMGVSSGSVYYWFEGKDDIYVSTVKYGIKKIVDKMFAIFLEHVDSPRLFFDVFLDEVDKYKDEFRLAVQVTSSPVYGRYIIKKTDEFKPIYDRYITMLCEEINISKEIMRPIVYMLIAVLTDYAVWNDREAAEMSVESIYKNLYLSKIEGSDGLFKIDFVHLKIPTTSLEESGKTEFKKNTKYTLINDYPGDVNTILYYTLDGSDPTDEDNKNRIAYNGEELKLTESTTVKTVYYSACGKCVECKAENVSGCWSGVYGEVGKYRYTIPKSQGLGGGGGSYVPIDQTRKYTKDIFGNEHPTHIGYINGYPDGSVQPEGDITREEIAAILYRITNHEYEKPFVQTGEVFPDVNKERWSAHDIEYMADKEIIVGYPDGEFKPGRNLTRAEFATLIFRFIKAENVNIKNPFVDLETSHWAYDEILALVNSGLIEGYPDKTYRPESNITRAEVMTVVNKVLGRTPIDSYVKSLGFNPFNDLYVDEWYYTIVLEATITHNYWLDSKNNEYKWEDWK